MSEADDPFEQAHSEPDFVASPCIQICVMDQQSGLCVGCKRTLEEIAFWSRLTNDVRRGVIEECQKRSAPLDQ